MNWNFPYSLPAAVTLGGLIVSTWQAVLLRSHVQKTTGWVLASTLGWMLAAATVAAADTLMRMHSVTGLPGALAYLGLIAAGGLFLGLVTGAVLARLLANETADDRI